MIFLSWTLGTKPIKLMAVALMSSQDFTLQSLYGTEPLNIQSSLGRSL